MEAIFGQCNQLYLGRELAILGQGLCAWAERPNLVREAVLGAMRVFLPGIQFGDKEAKFGRGSYALLEIVGVASDAVLGWRWWMLLRSLWL